MTRGPDSHAGRGAAPAHPLDVPRAGTGAGWLIAAAACSFAIALLHLAMTFAGAPAYEYFGAPSALVAAARRGSAVPVLITLLLACLFGVFGLYGLSGAGRGPRLPLLRLALIGISGLFLLRGVVIVPELILLLHAPLPARLLAFSIASLIVGILFAVGTVCRWPALQPPAHST